MKSRNLLVYIIILVNLYSCKQSTDRDHLHFESEHIFVKARIVELREMLNSFPIQYDSNSYQNFYVKRNYFYINNIELFSYNNPDMSVLAQTLNIDEDSANRFFEIFEYLYKNNIDGGINSCMGWEFFYKLSSDRGQYRAIILNKSKTNQDLKNCDAQIVDSQDSLLLIKYIHN